MTLDSFPVERYAAMVRERIDRRLEQLVPREALHPQQLHRAMRYSLLAPGKRIRPLITVLAATHLGGSEDAALAPACAIEMVHTASLILDDLPAMDDARLRRGRPANHVEFGEDTALLAGVALLNLAFGVVADAPGLDDTTRLAIVRLLSESVGSNGIIAGQLSDLGGEGESGTTGDVELMHHQKTGSLFVAAAETGARVAGIDAGTEALAGKDVGQDAGKATFVSLMGAERARSKARDLVRSAAGALEPLGPSAKPLVDLAFSLLRTVETAVTRERGEPSIRAH
jgi:geranylgeranyl diphosphate synthase type II